MTTCPVGRQLAEGKLLRAIRKISVPCNPNAPVFVITQVSSDRQPSDIKFSGNARERIAITTNQSVRSRFSKGCGSEHRTGGQHPIFSGRYYVLLGQSNPTAWLFCATLLLLTGLITSCAGDDCSLPNSAEAVKIIRDRGPGSAGVPACPRRALP